MISAINQQLCINAQALAILGGQEGKVIGVSVGNTNKRYTILNIILYVKSRIKEVFHFLHLLRFS